MTEKKTLDTIRYIAKLLVSLQRSEDAPALTEDVTLADVYALSHRHSLGAAAYFALSSAITDSDTPEEYKKKWARELELATVQHIKHTAAFAEITQAFTKAKLRFLPIKGFLFKKMWKHPELRTMADMDIVVAPEDHARAGDILLSLGYTLDHDGNVHCSYIKGRFVNVELHRMLYDGATESFDGWTAREDNPYWYEMSLDDFLIFNLRHAFKHYENGGCGLRTVFDFYLFFEEYGRQEENVDLIERMKDAGLYEFYQTVCLLVDAWFLDTRVSEAEETALYVASGGVYGTLDNGVSYSIKKRGSKAKHFLWRLFPPFKIMAGRYKWVKKCPILLPIAYVVRLITALFDGKARREMQSIRAHKNDD